jgi:predicted acetyltransferase
VDVAIRQATEGDFADIGRLDSAAFGFTYSAEQIADAMTIIDPARFLVAEDQARIVGVTGDYPLTMQVPGGKLDVPGVTWVSVSPTHRRRGILRELMHTQLRGYADAGEAAAILTASEGGIYGRFGYGPATATRKTEVDRRRAELAAPPVPGTVELLSADEARTHAPDIHRRWCEHVPGALNRTEKWWDLLFLDRESDRNGMTSLFYLFHPDGYLAYRVKEDWDEGHLCWISDYFPVTAEAHQALWNVLLGMDLFATVSSNRIPIDDPLPWLLTDPRQLKTKSVADGVWVRPIDIARTLAARHYALEVEAVFEVSDDLFGDGRYRLLAGPDGARCERTDGTADVRLSAAALGSAFLGGHRLTTLASAGRVRADDPGLLSRLDRAFLAERAPFHGTAF